MTDKIARSDVIRVFEVWRASRPRPEAVRMTLDRERTILARLRLGYSPDDLIRVIEYILNADSDDARWMRGQHPRNRRAYLDLENILRVQRLGERVEAAILWRSGGNIAVATPGITVCDTEPFRLVAPDAKPAQDAAPQPSSPPQPSPAATNASGGFTVRVIQWDKPRG